MDAFANSVSSVADIAGFRAVAGRAIRLQQLPAAFCYDALPPGFGNIRSDFKVVARPALRPSI
ncbi:MAG TPA: hypothetical protein VGC89_22735 [Pyrinomonadaceae bacterium]